MPLRQLSCLLDGHHRSQLHTAHLNHTLGLNCTPCLICTPCLCYKPYLSLVLCYSCTLYLGWTPCFSRSVLVAHRVCHTPCFSCTVCHTLFLRHTCASKLHTALLSCTLCNPMAHPVSVTHCVTIVHCVPSAHIISVEHRISIVHRCRHMPLGCTLCISVEHDFFVAKYASQLHTMTELHTSILFAHSVSVTHCASQSNTKSHFNCS